MSEQPEHCPFCGLFEGHRKDCVLGMAAKWEVEPPALPTHKITLREIAKLGGMPILVTSHGHVVGVLVPVSTMEEARRVKTRLQDTPRSF